LYLLNRICYFNKGYVDWTLTCKLYKFGKYICYNNHDWSGHRRSSSALCRLPLKAITQHVVWYNTHDFLLVIVTTLFLRYEHLFMNQDLRDVAWPSVIFRTIGLLDIVRRIWFLIVLS